MKKEVTKRCSIERYDEAIKEPPYLTIPIDNFDVYEPEQDDGGEEFARRLSLFCKRKGYHFKFYTVSNDDEFDYKVVVY